MTLTIEARIEATELYEQIEEFASFYCYLERTLFNDLAAQGTSKEVWRQLKCQYIAEYRIHARLFNALYSSVKGKVILQEQQYKTNQKVWKKQIQMCQQKIKQTLRWLTQGFKRTKKKPLHLHEKQQCKRNVYLWQQRIERLKKRLQQSLEISCVFGSKAFYKKQWTDEQYINDHEAWKAEWQRQRTCHFNFLGSKAESAGNQLCQYKESESGETFLCVRLPYCFDESYLQIPVRFSSDREYRQRNYYSYFQEALEAGVALSYRFLKRENGLWYVQVSFTLPREVYYPQNGYIGVDVNYGLLAAVVVDRYGNFCGFQQFGFDPEMCSAEQLEAQLSDFVNRIVAQAKDQHKGVSIEKLEFFNKKLQDRGKKTNRKLHLLSYEIFRELLESRCKKAGVYLKQVNPAYSSVIGRYKYQSYFGISTHVAAAFVVARRAMFLKEKIPSILAYILHRGEAVKWQTSRCKHHWAQWNFLNKHLANCVRSITSWEGGSENRFVFSVNRLTARCNRTQLSFLSTLQEP